MFCANSRPQKRQKLKGKNATRLYKNDHSLSEHTMRRSGANNSTPWPSVCVIRRRREESVFWASLKSPMLIKQSKSMQRSQVSIRNYISYGILYDWLIIQATNNRLDRQVIVNLLGGVCEFWTVSLQIFSKSINFPDQMYSVFISCRLFIPLPIVHSTRSVGGGVRDTLIWEFIKARRNANMKFRTVAFSFCVYLGFRRS